jgi:MSHA biogenesis protein MshN
MSLVNKMLRDLDARAPRAANDTVVPSLAVARPPRDPARRRAWIVVLFAIVGVGAALGAWRWWPRGTPAESYASVSAGPVSPAAAPPVPSALAASAASAPKARSRARLASNAPARAPAIEAIAIAPQEPDRFDAAAAALRDGDPARAESLFRELLASRPGHVRARELLAGLYVETGRMTEAIALLDRGLALAPGHRGTSLLLARLLTDQGDETRARTILDAALTAHAADADLNALAAALDARAGRNEQAIARYRAVLAARPGDGRMWLGLGVALEALGEQRDARDAFQRARLAGLDAAATRFADERISALTPN